MSIDPSDQDSRPYDIENMDLHDLIDLQAKLDEERAKIPFELVVPGKICGLAVAMLIDSGASVSVMSHKFWKHLKASVPSLSLLPSDTRICTANGEEVPAAGCLLVKVNLAEEKYLHQFLIVDVAEDLILGLDFLARYNVDCDWRRGVLRLRGREVQACCQYSTGDGKVRRLATVGKIVLPANTHSMIQVRVKDRNRKCPGDAPDWGLTAPARKPAVKHGIVTGRALVDGSAQQVIIPVLNPTDTTVVLPRNTDLAFMAPVRYVEPVDQNSNENSASRK